MPSKSGNQSRIIFREPGFSEKPLLDSLASFVCGYRKN